MEEVEKTILFEVDDAGNILRELSSSEKKRELNNIEKDKENIN